MAVELCVAEHRMGTPRRGDVVIRLEDTAAANWTLTLIVSQIGRMSGVEVVMN